MDFAAELDALMGKNRNSATGTKVIKEHYTDHDVSLTTPNCPLFSLTLSLF